MEDVRRTCSDGCELVARLSIAAAEPTLLLPSSPMKMHHEIHPVDRRQPGNAGPRSAMPVRPAVPAGSMCPVIANLAGPGAGHGVRLAARVGPGGLPVRESSRPAVIHSLAVRWWSRCGGEPTTPTGAPRTGTGIGGVGSRPRGPRPGGTPRAPATRSNRRTTSTSTPRQMATFPGAGSARPSPKHTTSSRSNSMSPDPSGRTAYPTSNSTPSAGAIDPDSDHPGDESPGPARIGPRPRNRPPVAGRIRRPVSTSDVRRRRPARTLGNVATAQRDRAGRPPRRPRECVPVGAGLRRHRCVGIADADVLLLATAGTFVLVVLAIVAGLALA